MSVYYKPPTGSDIFRWAVGSALLNPNSPFKGIYWEEIAYTSAVRMSSAYTLVVNKSRRLNYRHMIAEALWNLTLTDISVMRRYFKNIDRFVADQPEDTRHMARWAYSPALISELPRVVKLLQEDKNSRRAVAQVPHDLLHFGGTPPCLESIQFFLRDGLLHAVANMRSNDVWRGLPLDMFQFSLFQQLVADGLGALSGDYWHQAASLHMYTADVLAATKLDIDSRPEQTAFQMLPGAWQQFREGALHADMIRLSRGASATHCAADYPQNSGFAPLLETLNGNYDKAPPLFKDLRELGHGVGW